MKVKVSYLSITGQDCAESKSPLQIVTAKIMSISDLTEPAKGRKKAQTKVQTKEQYRKVVFTSDFPTNYRLEIEEPDLKQVLFTPNQISPDHPEEAIGKLVYIVFNHELPQNIVPQPEEPNPDIIQAQITQVSGLKASIKDDHPKYRVLRARGPSRYALSYSQTVFDQEFLPIVGVTSPEDAIDKQVKFLLEYGCPKGIVRSIDDIVLEKP